MIVTLTGGSGAGKSTIGEWLRKTFRARLKPVVSITTRRPRDTDPPGEYEYMSKEKFLETKRAGRFIWDVCPYGTDLYGTMYESLKAADDEPDAIFLMVLELASVRKLHIHAKKVGLKIASFYILSPSEKELRRRLEKRKTDPAEMERRIEKSRQWDAWALGSGVPYVFVRNDLDDDGQKAASTIATEIIERMSA